jgi:hypothetical protein
MTPAGSCRPRPASPSPVPGRSARPWPGGAADNWLETSTIKRVVTNLVADGDTGVTMEFKTATTHAGERYANDFVWVFTCRDGLIWQVRTYTDTLVADRVLGLANKAPTL